MGEGERTAPVAAFCVALGDLQRSSGLDRARLAHRLGYSRSQLYAILDGRISRPPDWNRLVEPLVRVCTGNDERAVADWRHRHAVLVAVHEVMVRQRRHATPGPADAARPVPAQLPPDVSAFTGRVAELAELDCLRTVANRAGAADPERREPAEVVILAISGAAGVGKTALAIRWARRVCGEFPDGQLYVNLRGDDAAARIQPIEALAGFLYALGVPAGEAPAELAEAAGLYRDLLADKRVLVLLDNARSAEQVRPLLPGAAGCRVLITSRDRLSGLVAREDARQLDLAALTLEEAEALITRILGEERASDDPEGVAELARACGRLPAALSTAAAGLAADPGRSIAAEIAQALASNLPAASSADGAAEAGPRWSPPPVDRPRVSDYQRLVIGLTTSASGVGLLAWVVTYGGASRPAEWFPGFALVVLGLIIPRWAAGTASPTLESVEQHLNSIIKRLADTIVRQDSMDAPRSRLDQRLLPLRWSAADDAVMDDLANIRVHGGRPLLERSELDGHGRSVVEYVRRLPRIVFLGGSGSGKTVLAHYLTRVWLEAREPGEAVPVVLPLASWDPGSQGLYEWISLELANSRKIFRTAEASGVGAALHELDNPGSRIGKLPAGARVAYELLGRQRILPILDGLDELPEPLRPTAIKRLNEELPEAGRTVLTCRPDEYEQAVTDPTRDALGELAGTVFEGAAVVTLTAPAAAEIDRYLTAGRPDAKWIGVVADLTANPDGELSRALSTPLMVWLARTIYARRVRGPDGTTPDALIAIARTDGAACVQRQLLKQFIPAVYAGTRWGPKAEDWLAFLARHLADPERRRDGIAWWLLGRAAKRAVGIAVGIVTGLLSAVGLGLAVGVVVGAVPAVISGLVLGVVFGVLCGLSEQAPTDVEIQVRKRFRASLRGGLVVAALAGPIIGGGTRSVPLGIIGGLTFGALLAFAYMHTAKVDTERAISPRSLLDRDRAFVGTYILVYGVSTGFAASLVFGPALGLLAGLAAGLAGGLVNGIQYAFSFGFDKFGAVAWGRFQVARAWLAVTRRLPWRLMTFLADARQLGVLRQEGGTYHFRHAELREQLAQPRASD